MASSLRTLKTGPDLPIPKHFRCPISLDLMKDPVTLSTGITYDRDGIETWLLLDRNRNRRRCPVTNRALPRPVDLTPNHALRRMIQDWCAASRSHGVDVDLVPAPRAPLTPARAAEMLDDVALAGSRRDRARLLRLVSGLRELARGSEGDRRCVSSSGAGRALAASLGEFAGDEGACSAIVSALACVSPLGEDVCRRIETPEALRSIVSVLRSGGGGSEGRVGAALVVKELVVDRGRATRLAEAEGLVEAVVELIEKPISPRATKASLVVAGHLAWAGGSARGRLAGSGMVGVLLEVLVDSGEKSVSEKALGALDGVLGDGRGREEARGHALAVPVLVKKMLRVSDVATGFAVSGLWKLFRGGGGGGGGLAGAALGAGAFEKLLLLLQVGCGEDTKEKASELLRMLNGWRGTNGEYCIGSSDFRAINRTF